MKYLFISVQLDLVSLSQVALKAGTFFNQLFNPLFTRQTGTH